MKTKRVLIGCAILAACSAGVVGWRHEAARRAPARAAAAPANARIAEDEWKPREERRYHVFTSTEVEGQGDQDSTHTTVTAELELTLVAAKKEPGRTVLRGSLRASKLQISRGDATEDRTDAVNRSLARPFAVALDSRGTVTEFSRDQRIESLAEGIIRTVVSGLQFVRPESGAPRTWSTEETDSTGRLTARYRRVSAETFEKRTERYQDSPSADRGRVNRQRSVATRLERKASGVLSRVERKEVQDATVMGVHLSSHSELSLGLTSIGTAAATPADLDGLRPARLDGPPAESASGKERLAELARGHSISELARVIAAQRGKSFQDQKGVLESLVAVLSVGGAGAAREAAREIRVAASPESARAVLGALASTDGADAKRTLAELARDSTVSEDLRAQALMGLGTSDPPTRESIEQLQALAQDERLSPELHGTALRALGAALGEQDAADPSVTSAALTSMGFLVHGLENAKSPAEAAPYADALGNAGTSGGLKTLLELVHSKSPVLRALAIANLRKMQGAEVDAVLANALMFDSDADVRGAALEALRYREPTTATIGALVQVIKHDPSKALRHQAVGVAAMYADETPELMAAIVWASENDPDQDVRGLAARFLNANSESGPEPVAQSAP